MITKIPTIYAIYYLIQSDAASPSYHKQNSNCTSIIDITKHIKIWEKYYSILTSEDDKSSPTETLADARKAFVF